MALTPKVSNQIRERLIKMLPKDYEQRIQDLPEEVVESYGKVLSDPRLRIKPITNGQNRDGVRLSNRYITLELTPSLSYISGLYINGELFVPKSEIAERSDFGDLLTTQTNTLDDVVNLIDMNETKIRRDRIRRNMTKNQQRMLRDDNLLTNTDLDRRDGHIMRAAAQFGASMRAGEKVRRGDTPPTIDDMVYYVYQKTKEQVAWDRENLTTQLSPYLRRDKELSPAMIEAELAAQDPAIEDNQIIDFLFTKSQYKEILALRMLSIQGNPLGLKSYDFKPIIQREQGDKFLGRLLKSLNVESAEFDFTQGVMRLVDEEGRERYIRNLHWEDDLGLYHAPNSESTHIPFRRGYFAPDDGKSTRVERLRLIDPTQEIIDGLTLEYRLTTTDMIASPLSDTTRSFIDLETMSDEDLKKAVLKTLKEQKFVLDASYKETNSYMADYEKRVVKGEEPDSLGAVAQMILDEDAAGIIDPYGTSNNANLGYVLYLTEDAVINEDGSITRGQEKHSALGNYLNEHTVGMTHDTFNRNQMSFTNALVATDVQKLKVAVTDCGLWNAEDAQVLTKKGASRFSTESFTGDKFIDCHGNKGVASIVVDPEMTDEAAEARGVGVKYLRDLVKANPDVDMIISPQSVGSRKNDGVFLECLAADEKKDLVQLDGSVIKGGIVEMLYFKLPQTAEHKLADYSDENTHGARNYSSQYRHGFSAKIGVERYDDLFLDPEKIAKNLRTIKGRFERCGVGIKDETLGVKIGNVSHIVDSPVTLDLKHMAPGEVLAVLSQQAVRMAKDNMISVNVDIGENKLYSPLLHPVGRSYHMLEALKQDPIQDSQGRNVLPLRMSVNDAEMSLISFGQRYNELLEGLAAGNMEPARLQRLFEDAVSVDVVQLSKKDNILKDVETTSITKGAMTAVIVPDPTLKIDEIRVNMDSDYVLLHRDPIIDTKGCTTMQNIGGGDANVIHVHPLALKLYEADCDGDTMGASAGSQLRATVDELKKLFEDSNITQQIVYNGSLSLGVDSRNVQAIANATGVDFNFDLKNLENEQVRDQVNENMTKMLSDPKAYTATAISFASERDFKLSLKRAIELGNPEGAKDDLQAIGARYYNPVTKQDNKNELVALIAKSEQTGYAGENSNKVVFRYPTVPGHEDLNKAILDITKTGTQANLQMKKNADLFPVINQHIRNIKEVFEGKRGNTNYTYATARQKLYEIVDNPNLKTNISHEKVDFIVDSIGIEASKKLPNNLIGYLYCKDKHGEVMKRPGMEKHFDDLYLKLDKLEGHFGQGIINDVPISTSTLAYESKGAYIAALMEAVKMTDYVENVNELRQDDLASNLIHDLGISQQVLPEDYLTSDFYLKNPQDEAALLAESQLAKDEDLRNLFDQEEEEMTL